MPTEKQKRAVGYMVENGGKASPAMKKAGYSDATAKNPNKLTDSSGYKELMDEYGLTDHLVVTSLVEDIKKKPQNRKPELELAAKMKGLIVERKDITTLGKELPSPILGGMAKDVPANDGNSEDSPT